MRVNKNYYNFSFGQFCGVFVDEKTMRKIAKLQAKTLDELRNILHNAEDIHASNWSIADEPAELEQQERILRFISKNNDEMYLKHRLDVTVNDVFNIRKEKHLYVVDEEDIIKDREQAEREHTEFLKIIYDLDEEEYDE